MEWWQFAVLGAVGGMLVEVLSIFRSLAIWQSARRTATGRVRAARPRAGTYIDLPAHIWLAVVRSILGAVVAALFGMSGQITGAYVAVALGFAAPSVLAQLGTIPQIATAIQGDRTQTGTADSIGQDRGKGTTGAGVPHEH